MGGLELAAPPRRPSGVLCRPIYLSIASWARDGALRTRSWESGLMPRSEGPGQAAGLGREEPHRDQRGQARGPAPGEEQTPSTSAGWGRPAAERLCRGGRGSPGGRQAEREPATCPRGQKGRRIPGCVGKSAASRATEANLHLCSAPAGVVPSSGLPSTRGTRSYWSESRGGLQWR